MNIHIFILGKNYIQKLIFCLCSNGPTIENERHFIKFLSCFGYLNLLSYTKKNIKSTFAKSKKRNRKKYIYKWYQLKFIRKHGKNIKIKRLKKKKLNMFNQMNKLYFVLESYGNL